MGYGGCGDSLVLVLTSISVWSACLGGGGFAALAETGDIPLGCFSVLGAEGAEIGRRIWACVFSGSWINASRSKWTC